MAHGDYTHIEVPADDLHRARSFYESALGWTFTEMADLPGYFLYRTPSGGQGVGGGLGKRGESAAARTRNYVEVDSIERTLPEVERLGGRVIHGKAEVPGQGWYAVIADTEGNELGLWENLPR